MKIKMKDLIIVSPDVGGMKRCEEWAEYFGIDMAVVYKKRVGPDKVKAKSMVGSVKGKHVLLVDDLSETAGTLIAAADMVMAHGAKSVYAAVSHPVLLEKGIRDLEDSVIKKLFVTNSVRVPKGRKIKGISVAPLLAEAIKRIHLGKSVTELFT